MSVEPLAPARTSCPSTSPLRIALLLGEVMAAGVETVLKQHGVRCRVSTSVAADTDVVIFDPAVTETGSVPRVPFGTVVVALSSSVAPSMRMRARQLGAAAFVDPATQADELVDVLSEVSPRWPVEAGSDPAPASGLVGFSPREEQVLSLICAGLNNNEIGARLFLGINTVKTYIRTAYRKAGVSSRTEAMLWGLQHGYGHVDARPGQPVVGVRRADGS